MSGGLFKERLRMLRKRAGLTQQAVAERLNIHRTAYTKYETSDVTPDPQGLLILAEMFGVSVDYLLGRDDTVREVAQQQHSGMELSLQEQQLVQMFRQLPYNEQQALVQRMQHVFRNRKKPQ